MHPGLHSPSTTHFINTMRRLTTPFTASFPIALALGATAFTQDDITWLTMHEDASKVPAGALGATDTMEKDYDWGDLDQDGFIDLVVGRKVGWTGGGPAPNVLMMNEGGTLVDRTARYASASDIPGDQGFLESTNDRDIEIVDVDADGWLDVVTCTAITTGLPKHLSHPRVYMNLGLDGGSNWLGLEYQDARFPDLGNTPFFCGVGSGDVTGDGVPDLYFAHYVAAGAFGQDDRMMINDGAGNFTDETLSRLTQPMLDSGFGTSAYIVDLNNDGVKDVLRDFSGPTTITYNDPNNEGFFDILQTAYTGAAYHVNHGDLNQDGLQDLIFSDDATDTYLINQGNDALGRVIWSTDNFFMVDGGFAGNNIIIDLDGDGWNEALITDADVDIPGCLSRMFIHHNRGGAIGGIPSMVEESGGGFTGATGITSFDMSGSHDVAVFDLDNDGDNDFILGRCNSTHAWINDSDPSPANNYCGPAVPNSSGVGANISFLGSLNASLNNFTLVATEVPTNQYGFFLASATQGSSFPAAISQGELCLGGTIARFNSQIVNSGATGRLVVSIDTSMLPNPLSVPILAGDTWNFVGWFRDNNPSVTSNFTDGIEITFE
jgi:hypothetical protein